MHVYGHSVYKNYLDHVEFIIENEEQFIIVSPISDNCFLYEVDFEKNIIIKKKNYDVNYEDDQKKYNTTLGNIIKKYKVEEQEEIMLRKIMEKVKISEDSKIRITPEQRVLLYREKVYNYYEFKDFNNNIYYIKDMETIKEIDKILNEIEK